MRLGTRRDGTPVAIDRGRAHPLLVAGFEGTMRELVELGLDRARRIHDAALAKGGEAVGAEELGAPIANPSKIVAIGLNYVDHASETKLDLPEEPLVFAKFPNTLTGPTDPIRIPTSLTHEVDFEAELGIVVGRRAKNVAVADALDHVFGYVVLNDVSARDLQFRDKQWVRGKSLDTFCPCGPWIVGNDEVPDPQALDIGCEVDGEVMQRANTSQMIFGVAELISRLSASFTLEPGDLIASGTPSGVGFTREPPRYLQPGSKVRTWITGIGEIENPVEAA